MEMNNYYPKMNLWQRPSTGVFFAVWMENGKQRKKSMKTKDKPTAKRQFRLFQQALIAGKIKPLTSGRQVRFFPFTDEALIHYETATELSTYKLYEIVIKRAKLTIGNLQLHQITPKHLDLFVADLIKEGLKTATVNKYFRHLKSVLNLAYRWEYLSKPLRFPKEIKEREKIRFLTNNELNAILAKIDDPELADFCLFSAATGLRISEIIRLTWKNIDNPAGYIRVSSEQKNKEDDRIPINDYARAILDKYQKDLGRVFRFKTRHWPSHEFKAACVKAGLPEARFHDLRHTFGTTLVKNGVDIRTIQKLMRHADIESTMVYAKVMPEHLVESSNKLDYIIRTNLGLQLVNGRR